MTSVIANANRLIVKVGSSLVHKFELYNGFKWL